MVSLKEITDIAVSKEPHEIASNEISVAIKEMFKLGMYFQWYVIQHIPIYFVRGSNNIAWTDGFGIYVTEKFIELPNKLDIIRHELYHIIFKHPQQLKKKLTGVKSVYEENIIKIVHNVVADAVVDGVINKENVKLGLQPKIPDLSDLVSDIIEGDVVKLGFSNAVEKMLYLIKKGVVKVVCYTPKGVLNLSSEPIDKAVRKYGKVTAEVINTRKNVGYSITINLDQAGGGGGGKPTLIRKPMKSRFRKENDIDKLLRDAVEFETFKKQVSGDKKAGLSGGLSEVYELLDVSSKKPEWEAKLSNILTSHLSRYAVISWHFINKKLPFEKPGIKYVSIPDIHILLDVSGSMLDRSLEQALKRVIYIAENYTDVKVRLYQWSTEVTLPEEISKKFVENLRKYRKIKVNTGGTVIKPALNMVLKHVKPSDAVVILTDGYIYDIDSEDVIRKMKELSKKAGAVIFASLSYIPENLPKSVHKVKIES